VILPLSFVQTGTTQTGIGRALYVSGGGARQPDVAWGYCHDPQGISTVRKRNGQDDAALYIKGGRTFDKTSLCRSETEGVRTLSGSTSDCNLRGNDAFRLFGEVQIAWSCKALRKNLKNKASALGDCLNMLG
jgi:hypothetical protein